MSMLTLAAVLRDTKGKGAARKLRRQDNVPAVFYGPSSNPMMLRIEKSALERLLREAGGENILLNLEIAGAEGAIDRRSAMIKDLQTDPLKGVVLHADFYEISMDKAISVNIPIELKGIPAGVENGGVLQHVRRELAISCLPNALVEKLELDVSGLDVGDAVHISDIQLPQGITALDEGHLTVAVVAAPTAQAGEGAEEELQEAGGAEASTAGKS